MTDILQHLFWVPIFTNQLTPFIKLNIKKQSTPGIKACFTFGGLPHGGAEAYEKKDGILAVVATAFK